MSEKDSAEKQDVHREKVEQDGQEATQEKAAESWLWQQGQWILSWFLPKDPQSRVDEMMETLRNQMPTPCLLLLGEPQVGKSSVVRALTQDPHAKIGEGAGIPVTDAMRLYPFPPQSELPLWFFLDIPGLGATEARAQAGEELDSPEAAALYQMLTEEAPKDTTGKPIPKPHLILLCVRADDSKLRILRELAKIQAILDKQKIFLPILVVQTCLHRLLHPHPAPYPFGLLGDQLPEMLPVEVATQLQSQREKIRIVAPQARFVIVDLTDEEDEVGEPMYGANALFEAVLTYLPDMMESFLRGHHSQFGKIYQDAASEMIRNYAISAGVSGALPPPAGDIGTLGITLTMVQKLAEHYKQKWDLRGFLDIFWSLGLASLLLLAFRYLLRRIPIPVVMAPLGALGAFSLTFSIGHLMSWYYASMRDGYTPSSEDIQAQWAKVQSESLENAREWIASWMPSSKKG
jgi:uncharacterized protein (DUF697 family)